MTEQSINGVKITQWTEEFDLGNINLPAIVAGMPNEVYHSLPGISKSGLDKINRSPAHYRHGELTTSKAMEIGSALHAAILEPEVFEAQYLMLPDVADRRSSEYKAAVKSRGEGNVLVGKEVARIEGMVNAITGNYKCAKIMGRDGWRELAFFANDPDTGVLCKIKIDFLAMGDGGYYAVDLKSTSNADPDEFSRSVERYNYHVQSSFYSDVFEWATGQILTRFWFAAVESEKPHGVICRYLCDDSVEIGSAQYRDNLDTYANCLMHDFWPCYPQPEDDDECVISLPGWKLAQHEAETVDEIY